jgi:hypothetical protein
MEHKVFVFYTFKSDRMPTFTDRESGSLLTFRRLTRENVQGIMGDNVILFIPRCSKIEYAWLSGRYNIVWYTEVRR